jgi:hypothetical protein
VREQSVGVLLTYRRLADQFRIDQAPLMPRYVLKDDLGDARDCRKSSNVLIACMRDGFEMSTMSHVMYRH